MANSLIKPLSIIKYKYFVKIIGIENKKELLTFIKEENDLKNTF